MNQSVSRLQEQVEATAYVPWQTVETIQPLNDAPEGQRPFLVYFADAREYFSTLPFHFSGKKEESNFG